MSGEGEPEFVDANIFVYADDSSAGMKQEQAHQLISRLWDTRLGCLSIQVLQEYFVTVTRKVPKPLTSESAEQRVRDLSRWTVFVPHAPDVLAAISLARRHQLAFWDAMIVESAAQLGCGTLWSEDLQNGVSLQGVKVRNPFA